MKQLLSMALALLAGVAAAGAGGIGGVVSDAATGAPLVGAVVVAEGPVSGRAQTDRNGHYLIENLEPGRYRVRAEIRGYEPGAYPEPVVVVEGQMTRGIHIRLRPKQGGTGSIVGTVTDAVTGERIAGAVVVAQGSGAGRARTDQTGHYLIENLAAGRYRVLAEAVGYEPGAYPEPVVVAEGQVTSGIHIRLRPRQGGTGAISGRVTDRATGEPVQGAVVVAKGPNGRGKARTDDHGNYVIRGLAAGRYQVGAAARRHAHQLYPEPVMVVEGQVTGNVDFALAPRPQRGAIVGRVVEARTGDPVPGALVVARGENGGARAVTDRHGWYRIVPLEPGTYRVVAAKRGFEPAEYPEPVVVEAGAVTRDINFRLVRRNVDEN